ncbi:MAG: hypothetical protein V4615_06975 [Bacteroidota bacterium]
MKLYQDCYELPLSVFLDCLLYQQFDKLCIEGEAPQEELLEKWANIYAEYLDLSEAFEAHYIFQLQKETLLIHQTITEVDTSLIYLGTVYDERLVNIIRDNGFKIKLDPDNMEAYDIELKRVGAKLAPLRLKLSEKQTEIDSYQTSKAEDTMDKKFFVTMLNRLAKFQGGGVIDARQIMTANYILLCKDYVEHIGRQSRKADMDGDPW